MVQELTQAFARLESEIAKEKGDFTLFALFLREDLPDRWDLIISAPWAVDRKNAIKYLVKKIQMTLGAAILTDLSRIVLANPDEPAVANLNRAIHIEHGNVEMRDTNVFGLPVKHAFIITSKPPSAAAR